MLGERWRLPKQDTDVFTALDLVRDAGGVPVFAHPRATKRGRVVPDELITEMAGRGLFGLEADHEDHSPAQREEVRALAKRNPGKTALMLQREAEAKGRNKLTFPAGLSEVAPTAIATPGPTPTATPDTSPSPSP